MQQQQYERELEYHEQCAERGKFRASQLSGGDDGGNTGISYRELDRHHMAPDRIHSRHMPNNHPAANASSVNRAVNQAASINIQRVVAH